MTNVKSIIAGLLLTVALAAYLSCYTVSEEQRGLLLYLGRIVENPETGEIDIKQPGLHFRIPGVHRIHLFDIRLQTLDIQSSRIVTAEKKDVLVDYYIKWQIADIAKYFTRTGGNKRRAEILLEQQVNDTLRAEFGRRTIRDVVTNDRVDIMKILREQARVGASELGLHVADVRIKRIDLPVEVSSAVYERMRAERERVATEHRSQGKAQAEVIKADADANVAVALATAQAEAAHIRGEGDAEAASIYARVYGQDPEFYSFYRSLEAYKTILAGEQNIFVLQPDSEFFQYFMTAQPPGKKSS